jgi:hypothetical protein
VIRFSAFLVAVAVGLLVAGVVTSRLMLVYAAIGVSGLALLALAIGALIKRRELFGQPESAQSQQTLSEPESAQPEPAVALAAPGQATPSQSAVPASSAWPAAAAGTAAAGAYRAADQPARSSAADVQDRPPAPRSPSGVPAAASTAPSWRPDAPPTQPLREIRPAAAAAPDTRQTPTAPPPSDAPATTVFAVVAPAAAAPEVAAPASPQSADQPSAGESEPSAHDTHGDAQQHSAVDEQPHAAAETPAAAEALATSASPEAEAEDALPAEQELTARQEPIAAAEPRTESQPSADDHGPAGEQASARATGHAATPADTKPAEAKPAADQPATKLSPPAAGTDAEPAAVLEREVTVVPGVPRYHTPQCLLIRFMGQGDLDKMTVAAARKAGCSPCRACLPDQPGSTPELGPPEPEREAEIVLGVLPRRLGLRTRSRAARRTHSPRIGGSARLSPGLQRAAVDGEHLGGDEPGVLGQGRGHLRVVR